MHRRLCAERSLGSMPDVTLHLGVGEFTTDETLGSKKSVLWVS